MPISSPPLSSLKRVFAALIAQQTVSARTALNFSSLFNPGAFATTVNTVTLPAGQYYIRINIAGSGDDLGGGLLDVFLRNVTAGTDIAFVNRSLISNDACVEIGFNLASSIQFRVEAQMSNPPGNPIVANSTFTIWRVQ